MDILFASEDGIPFSIEVDYYNTILEIKQKVEKYRGIEVHKQTLVFNGCVLGDKENAVSCGLSDGSVVKLFFATAPTSHEYSGKGPAPVGYIPNESSLLGYAVEKVRLSVKTPSCTCPFAIEIDPNHTIEELKKMVQPGSVPINRLALEVGGVELPDHMLISNCGLSEDTVIDVFVKAPEVAVQPSVPVAPPRMPVRPLQMAAPTPAGSNKITVMVLPWKAKTEVAVDVNPRDRVEMLRDALEKLQSIWGFNLPADGYFFIHKQNVLDEEKSFLKQKVQQGDLIEIFKGNVLSPQKYLH